MDLDVYPSHFGPVAQVVLLDGVFREEFEGDLHVLIVVEGSSEVEVVDIYTHVFSPFWARDAIPEDLGG